MGLVDDLVSFKEKREFLLSLIRRINGKIPLFLVFHIFFVYFALRLKEATCGHVGGSPIIHNRVR